MSRQDFDHTLKMLFEISEKYNQPLQINAPDNLGNTPLHYLAMETCNVQSDGNRMGLLLRNGADPNAVNNDGSTPLHLICKNSRVDVVEPFFSAVDELNQRVSVDARNNEGRTPLELAVVSLCPDLVDVLLERGADLTSFVLPPESDFRAKYDRDRSYDLYREFCTASNALASFETLEKRGYEVGDFALMIMKIFSWIGLLKRPRHVSTHWYDDEEFACEAKKIKILPKIDRLYCANLEQMNRAEATTPSLSLYDLVRLRPEEAANVLPYRDYYNFNRLQAFARLPYKYKLMVMLHLFEKASRGFCRRRALEHFMVLTHCRLPILCSEMVIDQLSIGDLCNICFAATGQDP